MDQAIQTKFTWSRAGSGGIMLELSQHFGPMVIKYFELKTGLPETLSQEIVYFLFSFLGGVVIWCTPAHFVSGVKDLIIGVRQAFKTWKDAANESLTNGDVK
jgi:hypothetical protein